MLQHHRLRYHQSHLDPFSLSSLKLGNLELSPKSKKKKQPTSTVSEVSPLKGEVMNTPPKPYLSIIDFNMLTRGGLEEATNKTPEKICPHHYQKLKSKTADKGKLEFKI
jgi:hypothetical protein